MEMNWKLILTVVVASVAALLIYEFGVKKLLKIDSYEYFEEAGQ